LLAQKFAASTFATNELQLLSTLGEFDKMKRNTLLSAIAVSILAMCFFATAIPTTTHAENFDNPKPGAVKWKVIDYNRVQAHPARVPYKIPGGIAFDFLFTPDTAALGTSHPSYNNDLLGDMSNKSLNATVGVTVTPLTQFTYFGEPDACGRPANVRFFFRTDTSGKFEFTDYWWSNPMSVDLEDLKAADVTLSVDISNPAMWSDWNGQVGTTVPAAFAAATQDVQFIGLSFGGGCFFENGVGIAPGTGSGNFRLMDFTATPTP
jgi:hypothetical protein